MDALREKIKDSEVKVEVDSKDSNLDEILDNIRRQYDALAKKNLKETDEWYQSKVRFVSVLLHLLPLVSLSLTRSSCFPV